MAKFKLTKTEKKILDLAAQSYRGTISTAQCDGVVSRDLRAVQSLRVKGLLQQVNGFTEWDRRRGYVTLYAVTHDAITEEGRMALEAI